MRAVVGLGANLGDREGTLAAAIERLRALPGVRAARASSFYETAPVGGPPQPPFLNAAVLLELEPARSAAALVSALLAVEASLGRVRDPAERFGPRTLDLDLLWTDGPPSDRPEATVPHPRLHERAFALVPLLEVVPDATAPDGTRYGDVLRRLGTEGVRKISGAPG